MGFLSSLFGGGAAQDAVKDNRALIARLDNRGRHIIDRGEQKSSGALKNAIAGYNPYTKAGAGAVGMYSNALGLNGAKGNAAATGAFQAGPGYQFAMDQGTQAALRGASAAGMLNSGNTLTALTGYGQGLANQEYGNWLDRLNGLSNTGLSAANGQANAYGGLSNLYQGTADDRLSLLSNVTQGLMGNNQQMAQIKEQQQGGLRGLISGGLGLGLKAFTGGLF